MLELPLMPIDQHYPGPPPLGVASQRLREDFLDHRWWRALHTGPDPLVACPWLGARILLHFYAHNRLGTAHSSLNAVDGCYRRHALTVAFLALAQARLELVLLPLRRPPRRLPKVLPAHHDPLAIKAHHYGVQGRLRLIAPPAGIEGLEVLAKLRRQRLGLMLGHLTPRGALNTQHRFVKRTAGHLFG